MSTADDKQKAVEIATAKAVLRYSPYLAYRPFLPSECFVDVLAGSEGAGDFCWCVSRDTGFMQRLCYGGFLPIATPVRGKLRSVVLPKLHEERCVVTDLSRLRVSRSCRKRARKLEFSVDTCFEAVLDKCVEQHGMNWIGLLAKEFLDMYRHPAHGVRMHSIEVWDGDDLVAGEIGWACGSIYTSATGFTRESGAGSVQLCALGCLLRRRGFMAWDFGMGMQYKYDMGAQDVPRPAFVALFRKARAVATTLECARANARDVIDGTHAQTKKEGEQQEGEEEGEGKEGSGLKQAGAKDESMGEGKEGEKVQKAAKGRVNEEARRRKREKRERRRQERMRWTREHAGKGKDGGQAVTTSADSGTPDGGDGAGDEKKKKKSVQ
ncbi:hypothetical protein PTSG_08438 [Salpingoeca rosetta]|uniref:Leucyl/phenylalanyl-tRNA-protein transferase n=1 Tax=Salpingoeca rosetta (strain ATCC 50818 / BSB-021) TaxID=946362 RepID=F2UJP3_SALR5|nr:uncharacterized protein PTSG_08438 [Salpingoeca rosetta]EGD77342.1 hypothetical protein PTSG_08438 [Salpingoeca rosetta]|eukprot:XP_004990686.1 hypothetical protein PTSG_08438 [Salpingoeca rosetta]